MVELDLCPYQDFATSSRRVVQPGQYEVEVRGQDGTALGSVPFTVQ